MAFLTFGNHKLTDDIAIFNMGTATDCPSKKLGLCKTIKQGVSCYAKKAEVLYGKNVINHRLAQEAEWRLSKANDILFKISKRIQARRKPTNYLRYNESGDFHDQSDIDKLSIVASGLKYDFNITTYGYSARSDLDYSRVTFIIKGSGWYNQYTIGTTIVLNKTEPVPEGFHECPGTYKGGCGANCNLCKVNYPFNIAFRKH